MEEDRRYFLSLGAAGSQSQHRFTQDHLSALDAVSIIGGVESRRGNPGGVLVLREYPANSGAPRTIRGPDQSRVVFTVDLTSADGLFSAPQLPQFIPATSCSSPKARSLRHKPSSGLCRIGLTGL